MPRPDTKTWVVLVRGDAEVASWLLRAGSCPDLSVVDRLARLQLTAQRLGCSIRMRGGCGRLEELLVLAGLADVVTSVGGLVGEVRGQPEGGEEVGVEEGMERGDPIA